ncbi:MAG: ABC-F family ATP-binding cassette domain-containing protein, partial [Spirochaetales bacterium]|nr:ABC-F family ATP-binding cassette domain-containing protein [Spirochaetales bacterium]
SGQVIFDGEALYCEQRTDAPCDLDGEFVGSYEGNARKLLGILGIDPDWIDRWDTLSHGERKRLQLGAALWRSPDLLAVDEPTNHLDGYARGLVFQALSSYGGIGILVSHDRDLLDGLTSRTLIIDNGVVLSRNGKFTDAYSQWRAEIGQTREAYMNERRTYERLKKEEARRRREADRADARRSKRGIAKKDSDARAKKNLARVTGKDAVAGKLLRQMDGRMRQAEARLGALKTDGERKTGISMDTERGKFDAVYTAGEECIRMGDEKTLVLPPLFVGPESRIGISGPNGSGKSTLIRHIVEHCSIDREKLLYVPQEIGPEKTVSLASRMRTLPKTVLGEVLAVVSRLGTEPETLLYSDTPSPGEIRKIMLALGINTVPSCIIMDEPTNHMDIPSVECVEKVLSETSCALILVSHDLRFLDTLTGERWRIECGAGGKRCELTRS